MSDQPFKTPRADDLILPFTVEATGTRGRVVRLGPLIDDILNRHEYPEPVSVVLGETLALAAILGESLKFEGKLIIQTSSDGPLGFMVASFSAPGNIRGYAKADAERLKPLMEETTGRLPLSKLTGQGHFAITIDPGAGMHRYQGIVPLAGESIADCAHEYFQQSEQIATRIRLAVGQGLGGPRPRWRAGGMMIQHLAVDGGRTDAEELKARAEAKGESELTEAGEPVEEAWNRCVKLFETLEDHELIDPLLRPERLLYRLFHEDGVRVYDTLELSGECRCSAEHIENVLLNYVGAEFDDLIEDGVIKVKCEFCNRDYEFDPDALRAKGEGSA